MRDRLRFRRSTHRGSRSSPRRGPDSPVSATPSGPRADRLHLDRTTATLHHDQVEPSEGRLAAHDGVRGSRATRGTRRRIPLREAHHRESLPMIHPTLVIPSRRGRRPRAPAMGPRATRTTSATADGRLAPPTGRSAARVLRSRATRRPAQRPAPAAMHLGCRLGLRPLRRVRGVRGRARGRTCRQPRPLDSGRPRAPGEATCLPIDIGGLRLEAAGSALPTPLRYSLTRTIFPSFLPAVNRS